jgi:hypothetical protein
VVRSLDVGGVCSSPTNGRFRIDRSKKGRCGGINNAPPQIKKVRQAGGLGTIFKATHLPFGQVAAGIVAFVDNSLLAQRGHLQALQCPTFVGSGDGARNSHALQAAILSAASCGSSGAMIREYSAFAYSRPALTVARKFSMWCCPA